MSFHTPAFMQPVNGRNKVPMLFAALADVFENPEIVDELEGEGTRAIVFRFEVDGHTIEGIDYLELDEQGLVRRITVMMRPLASLQVLADRMRDTIESLQAD